MTFFITRRTLLVGGGASLATAPVQGAQDDLAAEIVTLEASFGGRLGVAIHDTGSARRIEHRAGERFPLCSTFKVLAAALVLQRVEHGEESLARRITYRGQDLVANSPETERHVDGTGMSVADLCAAAITLSDNTAGNLLLASFGGPAGITSFARSLGDPVTRLDRTETSLNEALPGDLRDTTSPAAMAGTLRRLLLGDALLPASRAQLVDWMRANKTGGKRLRAGLPREWVIGDKTGSGEHGTANDVAIVERAGRHPMIVAVYYTEAPGSDDDRNEVIAGVGRIAARV
jgi:beta-lactamase class A